MGFLTLLIPETDLTGCYCLFRPGSFVSSGSEIAARVYFVGLMERDRNEDGICNAALRIIVVSCFLVIVLLLFSLVLSSHPLLLQSYNAREGFEYTTLRTQDVRKSSAIS
jgi:hypothetical protein